MTRLHGNIGRFDSIARRVVGACAVVGGLASLDGFFWSFGFITWILLAMMMALGLFFITGGFRGGSAVFGLLLIAFALGDAALALTHHGTWALLIGVIAAAVAFVTAEIGWCPINSMLGKDTHNVDAEWASSHHPHPAH